MNMTSEKTRQNPPRKKSRNDSNNEKEQSNFRRVLSGIRDDDDTEIRDAISDEISSVLEKYDINNYHFLILYDDLDSIGSYHSDALYRSAYNNDGKPILLILHSKGGRIEPAYLISKTLKRLSGDKFAVAVPRRAKSAATLIALGADEIHMGLMSELGPIDPQVNGLPALSLGNALDVIADLVSRFPDATNLLEKYIEDQVPVRLLGYFQRVNESAVQYAERLLSGKPLGQKQSAYLTADHLVNHYKDHSFVIDVDEAKDILGDQISEGTKEYQAANEIFNFLSVLDIFFTMEKKGFWVVGGKDGFSSRDMKPRDEE